MGRLIDQEVIASYRHRGLVVHGNYYDVDSIQYSADGTSPSKKVDVTPVVYSHGRRTIFVPNNEINRFGGRGRWMQAHTVKPV